MVAIAAMKALVVRDGKFLALELEIGRSRIWDLPGERLRMARSQCRPFCVRLERKRLWT